MTVNPNMAGTGFLGIVMLDTRFIRPPGDIGNPATFCVPVQSCVVPGAYPSSVVCDADRLQRSGLAAGFVAAVSELCTGGAWAISSSCGFLVLLQADLQQAAGTVPVRTSSLLQLPGLLAQHERIGVLTIDSQKLSAAHFCAAGVSQDRLTDLVVQGMPPQSAFVQGILGNQPQYDLLRAEQEVVAAALALQARAPDLRHVVLECTNLPPYQASIEAATGLACWSLRDDPILIHAAQVQGYGVFCAPAAQARL